VYISIIISHNHFLIVIVVWDVLFTTEPANESRPKMSDALLGRFSDVIDSEQRVGTVPDVSCLVSYPIFSYYSTFEKKVEMEQFGLVENPNQ